MHMQPFLNHFHATAAPDPKGFRDGKKRPSFLAAMATFTTGFHQMELVNGHIKGTIPFGT